MIKSSDESRPGQKIHNLHRLHYTNGFSVGFHICCILLDEFVIYSHTKSMRDILYTKVARKGLEKMPKAQRIKMLNALENIAAGETGRSLDIKKMQGQDSFRLRIGQYRALYSLDMVVMTVEKIGPRGAVY